MKVLSYLHFLQQTRIAKDSHKVVPLGVNKDEFVMENEDSLVDDDEDTEHDEMDESDSELLHLPDDPYSSSDETL